MLGIDHDPGQARGIEQALVEIEVPGAGLLRQQAALQPVGQAADHALEAAELLVELGAQPAELDRAAKLARLDHLVELGREHPIGERVAAGRDVLRGLERGLGVAIVIGAGRVGIVEAILGGAGLGGLVRARRGRLARGLLQRVLAGAVARRWLGAGALLVLGGLALIGVLVVRLLAQILGQPEMRQHLTHPDRELLLAAELLAERRPVLAGAAVEDAPPGVQDLALLLRQAEAEQALAGVQLERLGEAGLGRVRRGHRRAPAAAGMGARQIAGDAGHAAGAKRLDPGLLEGVEHRARELALGVQPLVQLDVVMAQAECGAVGLAPHPCDVLVGHRAPRHRQRDARGLTRC